MSGITLGDIANDNTPVMETLPVIDAVAVEEETIVDNRTKEILGNVLKAETGAGSIGDYLEHPMNFNKSMGLAQMLRGLTGMVGNLKLAIIDVGVGFLRFSREKKGVVNNDVFSGGGITTKANDHL